MSGCVPRKQFTQLGYSQIGPVGRSLLTLFKWLVDFVDCLHFQMNLFCHLSSEDFCSGLLLFFYSLIFCRLLWSFLMHFVCLLACLLSVVSLFGFEMLEVKPGPVYVKPCK